MTQNFLFYWRYGNIKRKIILFLLFNAPNCSAQSDIVTHKITQMLPKYRYARDECKKSFIQADRFF